MEEEEGTAPGIAIMSMPSPPFGTSLGGEFPGVCTLLFA
jgi:hypothetical protein